jgi:hypothetical protein
MKNACQLLKLPNTYIKEADDPIKQQKLGNMLYKQGCRGGRSGMPGEIAAVWETGMVLLI